MSRLLRLADNRKFITRRTVLRGATATAGLAAASGLGMPAIAQSKPDNLVIASGGGALDEAYKAAYFDSFTEKTGIQIITAPYAGLARVKSMIEANNVDLDVLNIDAAEAPVAGNNGWLEPLDWGLFDRGRGWEPERFTSRSARWGVFRRRNGHHHRRLRLDTASRERS